MLCLYMNVHVCVCVCVCVYMNVHVCVCVCVRERERERRSVNMCVYAHTQTHALLYIYIHRSQIHELTNFMCRRDGQTNKSYHSPQCCNACQHFNPGERVGNCLENRPTQSQLYIIANFLESKDNNISRSQL